MRLWLELDVEVPVLSKEVSLGFQVELFVLLAAQFPFQFLDLSLVELELFLGQFNLTRLRANSFFGNVTVVRRFGCLLLADPFLEMHESVSDYFERLSEVLASRKRQRIRL